MIMNKKVYRQPKMLPIQMSARPIMVGSVNTTGLNGDGLKRGGNGNSWDEAMSRRGNGWNEYEE
jgi:hypothetical protein